MDNDEEYLSEEEEFQREQEARLKAAAQRAALADHESFSSSEDEAHYQQQRKTSPPRAAPRSSKSAQPVIHSSDEDEVLHSPPNLQRENSIDPVGGDWSDEEHDGFRYHHRNDQTRRSINRGYHDHHDYTSEEDEVAMSVTASREGRHEPNQDEMGKLSALLIAIIS